MIMIFFLEIVVTFFSQTLKADISWTDWPINFFFFMEALYMTLSTNVWSFRKFQIVQPPKPSYSVGVIMALSSQIGERRIKTPSMQQFQNVQKTIYAYNNVLLWL